MKLLHTIDTSPNPNALCVLSPSSENCFLAYPPNTTGASGDLLVFDAINLQAVNIIPAHKSPLSCVNFNYDGTMLATASDKGTVIRVFSVPTGNKLFQLRRGTYNARIFSLSFDLSSTLLAVSSDTDTVHVFRLLREADKSDAGRRGSHASARSSTSTASTSTVSPVGSSASAMAEKRNSGGVVGSGVSLASGALASVYGSLRSPFASATSAISSYILPESITEIWEPQRDFAFAKLPLSAKGLQNACALGPLVTSSAPVSAASTSAASVVSSAAAMSVAGATGSVGDAEFSPGGSTGTNISGSTLTRGAVGSHLPQQLMVVTSAGSFFQYAIDMDNGGECVFVKECSLLDE